MTSGRTSTFSATAYAARESTLPAVGALAAVMVPFIGPWAALFFLIAGFLARTAFHRRGLRSFVADRAKPPGAKPELYLQFRSPMKLAANGTGDIDGFYTSLTSLSLTPTAFVMGSGLVTRRKFSKSEFWNDVRKYGITAMQYVGEICRYLLTNPPQANDKEHKLRVMTGTGLATELWNAWVERFGDMQIIESWGSTEANTSTVNVDNRVGSVGRIPDWTKTNLKLLAYDVDNDCHISDENGKKRLAKPGADLSCRIAWQRGAELEVHYVTTLMQLGGRPGLLGQIFTKAQNKIQDPAKLSRLISMIDETRWVKLGADVKGDIYEGLLQKNAEDTKSGAGQYFTPRPLIQAMVECVRPW